MQRDYAKTEGQDKMNKNWRTPEEIQFQKKRKEKMLFLAIPIFSIILGVLIAIIANQGI